MSKELVIGSNRHEIKVAVLEDDQLVEVYFQRGNEYSLAGSIHKGRVTRVLPGMQSAFVDLGLERDTFLYVSDFFEEPEDLDALADEKPVRIDRREKPQVRLAERTAEERGGALQGSRSASPESPRAHSAEADASNAAPSGQEPLTTPEVTAGASIDRTEADRGFRGDRRGRRSRRRRSRGRGFPENKYAQPVSSEPMREPDVQAGTAEEQAPIILPGESLAKYRNVSVSSPEGPAESESEAERADEDNGENTSSESDFLTESEAELDEDLEARAEEIELEDKILSHHEEPSVAAEEEKIEEVKDDRPVEVDEEDERQASAAEAVEPEQSPQLSAPESNVVPHDLAPEGEPLEIDEFQSRGESGEQAQITEQAQIAESAQPQTAVLREQGGRYMHRLSRRMRRRRGGNRFSTPAQEFAPRVESSGSGAGAATALEREPRAAMRGEDQEERVSERAERAMPSITELLKPGQEIIVQIAKEPLGQKGARITSHVALPGRYVVFMPSVNHIGVSRKIASEEERQRLKRILHAHRVGTTGGFIVRTAGEGVSEEEIAADMNFLYSLWLDIRQKAEKKPAPALLHYDVDVVERLLRDRLNEDFKAIWVDNEDMYENVLSFMQRFQPALVTRVKMYTRSAPIFDAFNITPELEKALRPKVWLKSGGYIVINQTEALVAIDINTGKFVGKSNRLEDTIVKTNTEAVKEIVRQIRLRDLGGIIVVDFIDMDERKNRQKVMQALEDAMRADRAPYKILQFNDFGLVAITRKRVKQSLERTLCSSCPYCEGAGYIKSVQTTIGEILVEAQKIARAIQSKDVVLRVNPAVAKVLKSSSNHYLEELEDILGRPVLVSSDPTLHQDKFDLA